MSKNIFFSIITPNYNSGDRLLRSINSLRNNNISFEHIIIDDCSTDDSFNKIEDKNENDFESNLILLKNTVNSGPGLSRNKGLELAKGKYVIFLDADDYFVSGALDKIYSIVKLNQKLDVLLFKHFLINEPDQEIVLNSDTNSVSQVDDPVRNYLLDKIISSPWCKCIDSKLAKNFIFPDLRVSQDSLYNLDIFINAEHVVRLDSILYVFDKTDQNSITRSGFNREQFLKFYKSWVFFERKALRELVIKDKNKLIASRKIKFCVLYYVSRLIIDHDQKFDDFVIGSIRKIYLENKKDADVFLNFKIKLFCNVFFLFPKTTITLCRTLKFRF